MNLTATFLGDPATQRRAQLGVSSVHGLWGGQIIVVAGNGAAIVRLIDPRQHERRYELELGEAAAHALLGRCIEHDLLAIDPPERTSLVPDETQSIYQLTCGRRVFALTSWANDPPNAGLQAIANALLGLRQHTADRQPSYTGPYGCQGQQPPTWSFSCRQHLAARGLSTKGLRMTIAHLIFYVHDQNRSTTFYTAVLQQSPRLYVPGMTEYLLTPNCVLGLMPETGIIRLLGSDLPDPRFASGIPRAELYLVVEDAASYHQRAVQQGATELSGLALRAWGDQAAYSLDLDGHVLAFAEPGSRATE